MILITSKKKEFSIPEIGNIHNELNNFYIHNIFAYQNDSKQYQDLLSRFSKLLNDFYNIIEDMKRFNNNNNNNNNKNNNNNN